VVAAGAVVSWDVPARYVYFSKQQIVPVMSRGPGDDFVKSPAP
jgi:hypothetical protein